MTASSLLSGKRVLVVGLGRSGHAAAELCLGRGAQVTVTDSRPADRLGAAASQLADRARLELGGHRQQSFVEADLIVLSPGVPALPELRAAGRAGVPIVGEIELAARFVRAPIIAITGTNGKSTTTSLVGAMLEASGLATFCGGNLGRPLAEAIDEPAARAVDGRVVVELSSFQLETVSELRAHVAVLLNLSEDHLDRYASYADYQAAKARVFERQTAADFAVVSAEPDQRRCGELAAISRASRLGFAIAAGEGTQAWLDADQLTIRLPGATPERYPRDLLRLPGRHNALNALAALLVARVAGGTVEGCRAALAAFEGLEHRMQLVAERDDVRYYNDSKATNVGSVVGSLGGFDRPVVLIAGGTDKGGDYAPLVEVIAHSCRHVVLIGAGADRIAEAIGDVAPVHRAKTMDDAVAVASRLARPGDAVVLSPACSSYDMFSNFEERGRVFAAAARALDPIR